MPSINLEMMKQLLEEFSEKETLTAEEIGIVEKEISTLEERVGFCHNKLKNLSNDKVKLNAMKDRYANGNFAQYIQSNSSHHTSETHPSASHSGLAQMLGGDNAGVMKVSKRAKDRVSADNTTSEQAVVTPNPAIALHTNTDTDSQQVEAVSNEGEPPTKDGSKPMKSINEALKGLFSK